MLTLAAIPALALLLLLGGWQWDRFTRKVAAAEAPAPAPMPLELALRAGARDFAPVTAEGRWRAATVAVYAVQGGQAGGRRFSVLDTAAGPILAERGFVADRDAGRFVAREERVRLTGVLRIPARANAFTPDNDPARGAFYWPDTAAIGRALGTAPITPLYLAPSTVDPLADGVASANPYADARGADQLPADRHFGYALTWWGLALALIGVYVAVHLRAGRLHLGRA